MNKPLSRRLFGKAMAAVPLAVSEAPKLAAQSMANTAGLMGTAAKSYDASVGVPQPMSDSAWREMRRKELQAIIDGKEDDFNREVTLYHRENARRAKLERISWAKRELANLVRKFF